MRKFSSVAIPVFFLLSLASGLYISFVHYNAEVDLWRRFFQVALAMIAWSAMFSLSSFRKTFWVRPAYLGVSILLFGILFKLQHWPYGNALILVGCLIAGTAYLIHFFKKPGKEMLDWLKATYLAVAVSTILAKVFRLLNDEISLISDWIILVSGMALLITFYVTVLLKGEKDGRQELDTDGKNVFRYPD